MTGFDRRTLLRRAAFAGAGLLLGCSDDAAFTPASDAGPGSSDTGDASLDSAAGDDSTAGDMSASDAGAIDSGAADSAASDTPSDVAEPCPDPFAGGTFLGLLPFVQEGGKPIGELYGDGLDGRLYTDLSALDTESMLVPNDDFYVRTRTPDQLDTSKPWALTLDGHVAAGKVLKMTDLQPWVVDQGVHLMECSGNGKSGRFGLLGAASWRGVPLPKLQAQVTPTTAGKRVLIEGFDGHSKPSANNHSTPGASWIFTPDELADAFLATEMNGAPLPSDHGKPLRLLVPGWYGCCNIKWVTRVAFVDDDAPATSQMSEFASRTHQDGKPKLAKHFKPARMQHAAMPIRVERWRLADGSERLRVVGVLWGGAAPTTALAIEVAGAAPKPVQVCPAPSSTATWALWTWAWEGADGAHVPKAGAWPMRMRVTDASLPTLRLDLGWYRRVVQVA